MVEINFGGLSFGCEPKIKSVQNGSITITGTSNTTNINSVDTNNSVLIYLGFNTPSSDGLTGFDDIMCRVELTNSTTVTGIRTHNHDSVVMNFCVLEFYPKILKSNQAGTIVITGTSATANINSVNIDKSALLYLGHTTTFDHTDTRHSQYAFTNIILTNSTTVTATKTASGYSSTVGYQVIEFY